MTVGYISAYGLSLPHTHPRANELRFVIFGQFETGIFRANDARFIMNTRSSFSNGFNSFRTKS